MTLVHNLPPPVVRYFRAVARWYATDTLLPPEPEQLARLFDPQISSRTLSRYRHDYREYLGAWPPRAADVPEWAKIEPRTPRARDDDFNVVAGDIHYLKEVTVMETTPDGHQIETTHMVDSKTGQIVYSRLRHLVALVLMNVPLLLDVLSDHRVDHVVRMQQLLEHACHLILG